MGDFEIGKVILGEDEQGEPRYISSLIQVLKLVITTKVC